MRLETSNEGEGKNRCHAPMSLSGRHVSSTMGKSQCVAPGQPFRLIPGRQASGIAALFESLSFEGRVNRKRLPASSEGQIAILLIFGVFKNTKPGGR